MSQPEKSSEWKFVIQMFIDERSRTFDMTDMDTVGCAFVENEAFMVALEELGD